MTTKKKIIAACQEIGITIVDIQKLPETRDLNSGFDFVTDDSRIVILRGLERMGDQTAEQWANDIRMELNKEQTNVNP